MSLLAYVHRHAKAFLFTIAVLVISGIGAMVNLPISLFPDVTFPRIVILADNGEQPAERMMVEVTKPLEEVASSIPGVSIGSFDHGPWVDRDIYRSGMGKQCTQDASISCRAESQTFGTHFRQRRSIQTEQMSVAVFPIHGIQSDIGQTELCVEFRDIALYQIRPALMRVKGIARVEVTGGDTREFLITVSPEKLAAYQIDIRQVSDAIEKTNLIASSGLVDNNYQLYLSLVSGHLKTTDDIKSVVITVQNRVPISVQDVAEVKPSVADKYIRTTAHGQDAVLINIIKQPTGSTVQIGQDVVAELKKLHLPPEVRFENFYDQGDFIRSSILSTRDSILIGIVLAMFVLFFFLRSWRISIVILLVVPATIACTLLCLYTFGLTINIMTLGGIAAAVGLIIDDSIVIIENIFANFARQRQRHPEQSGVAVSLFTKTAAESVHELMPAIIGSTASTIVIYIPLAFLGGVTGAFFASLSVTMVCAMLISFFFSITLSPLLASLVLREKEIEQEISLEDQPYSITKWYERTIRWLLRFRWVVIPAGVLLIGLTYGIYTRIGSEFMPEMDEGTFVLDYWSPPGTSLNETNRMLMKVEHVLMDIPEVETYSRRTGTQLGFFLTEANTGDFLVKLKKERRRQIQEVISEVREKVESTEPSLRIEFGQLMMDVVGDLINNPSPVEIKLFGDDTGLLNEKAEEVSKLIETVPGVVDVFNGIVISGPSFIIKIDPVKASLAGFSVSEVRDQLETIMRGSAESQIQKGEKLIAVRTRFPDAYRTDVGYIEHLQLINAGGVIIPLSTIGVIQKTPGQAEIHRDGLKQLVAVTARLSGRDLGSCMVDIQKKLQSEFHLPRNMTIEYGGVYQTQQESFRGLVIVALAAFLLVFIVLLFEFGEFAVPVSIFFVNVLSLFGTAVALWMAGVTLNISSMVGIIMIIGIVAENAIFVMHVVHTELRGGTELDEALVRAVKVRARPILMTTLAAVFALLPLALGIGSGAQMQQPLAVAVIGGFSVSSLLLFFGLPMIYSLFRKS